VREVTDPAELNTARELLKRLEAVEPLIARWAKVDGVVAKASSELALDDEHSAWRQLSHAVNGGLHLALDNLRAFRDLVRPEMRLFLPQFAHYSLLRSALEGASLALWLIAPDDPKERIQRLLRTATAELHDEDVLSSRAIEGISSDPERSFTGSEIDQARKQKKQRHKKHIAQIRVVARKLGIDDPTSASWTVGYAEIVREATAPIGIRGYMAESVWRQISGLAHPSLMRMTARSDLEVVSENRDGSLYAILTTDIGLTKTAFEAALLNATHAVEGVAARKIRIGDRESYRPEKAT